MVAIAAVDEAGNVDPEPAVWTWSVDARPRTSMDSAPQVWMHFLQYIWCIIFSRLVLVTTPNTQKT